MSVNDVWAGFRRNVRYHGVPAALQVLGIQALRKVVGLERVHLFAFDEFPKGMDAPAGTRARRASPDDVLRMAADPSFALSDLTRGKIEELFAAGHVCLLNLVGGEPAGYSWLRLDRAEIPRIGVAFDLSAEEGYTYRGFTHPRFRGHSLGNDRFLFWLAYLHREGRKRLLTDFSFDNKATITRARKLSMPKIGTATRVTVGPMTRLILEGEFRQRGVVRL